MHPLTLACLSLESSLRRLCSQRRMGSTVCQPSDSCQNASLKIPTLILVETRNAQEGRAEPSQYGEVQTSDVELLVAFIGRIPGADRMDSKRP